MFFPRRNKKQQKERSKLREDFLDACARGKPDEVEKLIASGADIHDYNGGRTALYYAVLSNNLETVRVLLDHGADVNARVKGVNGGFNDFSGTTPLLIAAQRHFSAIANALLDYGADVRVADNSGLTALHYAAKRGDAALAQRLIDKGADINAKDKWKHVPEYYAQLNNHRAVVMLLWQEAFRQPSPSRKPPSP